MTDQTMTTNLTDDREAMLAEYKRLRSLLETTVDVVLYRKGKWDDYYALGYLIEPDDLDKEQLLEALNQDDYDLSEYINNNLVEGQELSKQEDATREQLVAACNSYFDYERRIIRNSDGDYSIVDMHQPGFAEGQAVIFEEKDGSYEWVSWSKCRW
jgi:hypothetical protein